MWVQTATTSLSGELEKVAYQETTLSYRTRAFRGFNLEQGVVNFKLGCRSEVGFEFSFLKHKLLCWEEIPTMDVAK